MLIAGAGCGDDGPGDQNQNGQANQNNQTLALCGNDLIEGAEECDDGPGNSDVAPDACRTDCRLPSCGDGVKDASELCDDGPRNSDVVPDACRVACVPATCGDLVVDDDRGERCDDGNLDEGDGCSPECLPEYCGNGVVDPGEECDDGDFEPGDGCGPTCLREECGNGFVDVGRGEGCDDGNLASHDGCSSACRAETPTWLRLPGIRGRRHHAMAYDVDRDVIVLQGGTTGDDSFDETWEYDGVRWRQVTTAHSPGKRTRHGMVYDASRGVMVLYGGQCSANLSGPCSDTWEYDGVDWTEVVTATSPGGRHSFGMAYDGGRGVTVIFAGFRRVMPPSTDAQTWEYDGLDWVQRAPATAPPARERLVMAYDADRARVVMFGGLCSSDDACPATTWRWSGTSWTSTTPSTSPPTRWDSGMTYDPVRQRIVMYGGGTGAPEDSLYLDDTWEWNGSAWSAVAGAAQPGARAGQGMAHHAGLGQTVLVDGAPELAGDTWGLAEGVWVPRQPVARTAPALAHDRVRGVTVLFGGRDPELGAELDDTWELDGVNWIRRSPVASPVARQQHQLVFDPSGARTILFGGQGDLVDRLQDTWAWDGQAWTELAPAVSPPGRRGAAMALEEGTGRIVLFGGDGDSADLDDTWELDGDTWTQVGTAQAPSPRNRAALAFDPARGQLVLFGGYDDAGARNDLWAYDGVNWTEVTPAGASPSPRSGAQLAYHEAGNLLLLFGGCASILECFEDTWMLLPGGWVEVTPPAGPSARAQAGIAYDARWRGLVVFSGSGRFADGVHPDTWVFRLTSSLPDEACANGADDDGDGLSDCADPDCDGKPCATGVCAGGVCQ
jgi:cysteine-rich repeat protein